MSKSSSAPVPTKGPAAQPNSGERSKAASMTPINDHQTTTEINLTKCHSVSYEKKGDQHGVTYHTSDNKQEWTPCCEEEKETSCCMQVSGSYFPPAGIVVNPATLMMTVQ